MMIFPNIFIFFFTVVLIPVTLFSEIIPVGSGSYTTNFPGVDEAGRNSFPTGEPQVSGPASNKKIPTNDWWSYVIKNQHANNLFNYPMALKTINQGLVVSYIPWGVYDDQEPIVVGISDLNTSQANVYDFSDWTVTIEWANENNYFHAKSGIGMPFIYFEKDSESLAKITINLGAVEVQGEKIIVEDARNGADFIIYAPAGSQWNQSGSVFSSNLNGNNYWSMAMVPQGETDLTEIAEEYSQYAYVFPQNTEVQWSYDENNSTIQTEFEIDVDVKEGSYNQVLQGLLPHQWNNLSNDSPTPDDYSYESVRGELKLLVEIILKQKKNSLEYYRHCPH